MAETLRGAVERVVFHNPENGYCVLAVNRGRDREPITVVGKIFAINAGESIEAFGAWVMDPRHGRQFRADRLTAALPTSANAIRDYLRSGAIRGVGPKMADKIVALFGAQTFDVFENHPGHLAEIRGIGAKTILKIRESWAEQRGVRDVTLFLGPFGIGPMRASRIFRLYGADAVAMIRANPYRLTADLRGVGFHTADTIARGAGVPADSPFRLRAAVRYVIEQATNEGHCGLPRRLVVERTIAILQPPEDKRPAETTPGQPPVVIQPAALEAAIDAEIADGRLVETVMHDEPVVFLQRLYSAEESIAQNLRRLLDASPHPLAGADVDRAVSWAEGKLKLELAPEQRDAIAAACRRPVLVITGGPGVGKTTLLRAILEIFAAKGKEVVLAAPTGRAAKRLVETTGRPAQTLHRLLVVDPNSGRFKHDERLPLEGDLFVLDESSMIDVVLADAFLRAVPTGAVVIFVGDVDQLPSVGPGMALGDIIASGFVPVVRLTQIFRQAQASRIVSAARAIHEGRLPDKPPDNEASDYYFIEAEEPAAIVDLLLRLVRERIPGRFGFDPKTAIQILVPMQKGDIGARSLNARLQAELNPPAGQEEIERFGTVFRVGDRVIQTENDYDKQVYNGDMGVVAAIDAIDQELTVTFDSRDVVYEFMELDELALAYALTIHKSQGSEYPCVVIPLHTQHFVLLERNLIYTAVTRGKRLVVVVGSRRAFLRAVRQHDTRRRVTSLPLHLSGSAK